MSQRECVMPTDRMSLYGMVCVAGVCVVGAEASWDGY